MNNIILRLSPTVSILPINLIKFSLGFTLATIMTWWLSFKVIEAYNKVSNSKEIMIGIAISFTILYVLISFFKMIDIDDSNKENLK